MIHTLRTHRIRPNGLATAKLHYCPSIIDLRGNRYMVYRCQNSLQSRSWLSVSRLDASGRAKWTKRLATTYHTAEDPRAAVVGDSVYVFYQSGASYWPKISPDDCTVRVAKFDADFELAYDKPLQWEGRGAMEKNWSPFFCPEKRMWYCIYSVNPWRVLEFDADWVGKLVYEKQHEIPWRWGEIRGGACPVRVLPPVGKFCRGALAAHYWGWMHSSYEPPKVTRFPRQYVGLLMSFAAEFPFTPTGISNSPVIWPDPKFKSMVHAHVAFPGGAILENGVWRVSYGEGDKECRIAEIMHDEVSDYSRNWIKLE